MELHNNQTLSHKSTSYFRYKIFCHDPHQLDNLDSCSTGLVGKLLVGAGWCSVVFSADYCHTSEATYSSVCQHIRLTEAFSGLTLHVESDVNFNLDFLCKGQLEVTELGSNCLMQSYAVPSSTIRVDFTHLFHYP